MINIGIIGYGYWGTNLVRNFYSAKDCIVKTVADAFPERLVKLKKNFPAVSGVTDANEIMNDPEIDAVVIATPVTSHFHLAKEALL